MPASLCAQCKAVLVVKLSMRGVGTMVSTYHRSPVLGFMDEGASMQAVACPLSLISISLRSAIGWQIQRIRFKETWHDAGSSTIQFRGFATKEQAIALTQPKVFV